jgi:solute carrier family 39 (zinc transporter), member 1/2/3
VDLNKKSSSAPLHVEDFHAETTAGKEVEGGHGHGHGLHQHGATDAGHSHSLLLDSRIEKRVGVYILEAGIASHRCEAFLCVRRVGVCMCERARNSPCVRSIIIGIALGVEEEEFKVLLIAIVFHQFFEGIALSTVVLESLTSKIKIAFMVLLFSITTPVGVSIALGIRETYSDTDPTTLYVTGVLDSVASGILIYDSLVNIIAPHFSSPEFRAATNMRRATQLGFLWLGVALMSILGIWA